MNYFQYRPSGFTWLTPVIKNLLIINILIHIARSAIMNAYPGMDLAHLFGLRFPTADNFRVYQVITYMFLHGNFWHIFFNMFILWMFGKPIEEAFGARRFLIYFFVTGIGAAILHYTVIYLVDFRSMFHYINAFLANPDIYTLGDLLESDTSKLRNFAMVRNEIIALGHASANQEVWIEQCVALVQSYKSDIINAYNVIGASGAVFGILLAFGMLYPNSTIYLYFAIPVKTKWFVTILALLELYNGFMRSGGNIAHLAHVGGMIFGFILIKIWSRRSNRPNYF